MCHALLFKGVWEVAFISGPAIWRARSFLVASRPVGQAHSQTRLIKKVLKAWSDSVSGRGGRLKKDQMRLKVYRRTHLNTTKWFIYMVAQNNQCKH